MRVREKTREMKERRERYKKGERDKGEIWKDKKGSRDTKKI